MEKKYEFTNFSIMYKGHRLHQIRALRYFGGIKKGDIGGYIETENNLSHKGDCWVYDNAYVYENAQICDNALIADSAKVYGYSRIYEYAKILGNAQIFGASFVTDSATVEDYAVVCDMAEVSDYAVIKDRAIIGHCSHIGGTAVINGNTFLQNKEWIEQGVMSKNTLEEQIRCQTGLVPFDGSVIAYKIVAPDLTSFYDKNFKYEIGEWAIAKDPDESDEACTSGLHFSNAIYWDKHCLYAGYDGVYLVAKINLEDIITVQRGKIRCRKAFVLGVYDKEST